ncbi:MAG: M20/M25/M40 family metallo-hydrolase [Armatimonadetes bacterium]|nr:M20/M25/M40 family metallo-hydrolase [Armatimonadota bacterium]
MLLPLIALAAQPLPDPDRLINTVRTLAQLPTRNTSSAELNQAAAWVAGEYGKLPGVRVELMHYDVKKGRRVPADKNVVQVVAVLPGEDDQRIVISGHLDTINLSADPLTGIAPGADDDASGVAVALECARLMSGRKWKHTMVFCAVSGEEQGLFGSDALAKRAKAEGWKINAMLNNDIVGTSNGGGNLVRLFSEDPGKTMSRELARYAEFVDRAISGFKVQLVFRHDRFARGGDHMSFNQQGYDAVRFTEAKEDFRHQHTADDKPEFVDAKYLAKVCEANYRVACALADAGDPPTDVKVKLELSADTTLTWKGGSGPFFVYWRDTTSPGWESMKAVGDVHQITLKGMSKDRYVFAVGVAGGVPVEAK